MFFEFLDMFIHQWEAKEDINLLSQEQEKEDWEDYLRSKNVDERTVMASVLVDLKE